MSLRFIERSNDRVLPPDYTGDVLVWDIDKTYLETDFGSFRGLARIPFELALDKRTLPGAVPLLRALRRGSGKESALVPLFFVSGSPPQLRRVIEKRMTLDGVDFDGITFKDQLGLLRARRPRCIKAQLGYKLVALLLYRREVPDGARWLLFGDDAEADAEVFRLFARVCAGEIRGAALESRLAEGGAHPDWIAEALSISASLPATADPVSACFIHLTEKSDPEVLAAFEVIASRSYLQTALVLASEGRIRREAVGAVAKDLRARGVAEPVIEGDLEDAAQRLGVPADLIRLVRADTPD
jgi:hypothetical protein